MAIRATAMGAAFGAAFWAMGASAQENGEVKAPAIEPPALFEMTFSDGALTGPGAGLILPRLKEAQFVLVGEEHGFAGAPRLALALARAGQKYGLQHHVVETGPLSEAWASKILQKDGVDGLAKALADKPLAVPFLAMREDAELARYFLENASRRTDAVWGVDQEFIGSPLLHFERLVRIAPGEKGRKLAQTRLSTERKAFASGKQGALFLFNAGTDDFFELRAAFRGSLEAGEIIDALEESAGIYQAFGQGRNFASNADRIELIRRQFLSAYHEAGEAPRVLLKMGAIHLGRGSTFLNTFDLGSLTDGMAAANGLKVLRVLYWPLSGRVAQVTPFSESAFAVTDYRSEELGEGLKAIGVTEDMVAAKGMTVIPLEPVRRKLEQKGLNGLSPEFRFFVLGFDFLVTRRNGEPATPLAK